MHLQKPVKLLSLLLTLILVLVHCRTTQSKASLLKEYKAIYIRQFRTVYFQKILKEGFNQSAAINEMISSDRSLFTEPILTWEDLRLIDSLVSTDNAKMRGDSISRIGKIAEGAEGKHVLGFVMDRLRSNYIDSIAKTRYKKSIIKLMYIN